MREALAREGQGGDQGGRLQNCRVRGESVASTPDAAIVDRVFSGVTLLERQVASLTADLEGLQALAGAFSQAPSQPMAFQSNPSAELYATLFGRFQLYRGPSRVSLGHNRPVVELCRYLVAHSDRTIPRDELLELLWPDIDVSQSLHRLHVAASSLRRLMDAPGLRNSCISVHDGSYSIPIGSMVTDCDLFERHYRAARVSVARGTSTARPRAFVPPSSCTSVTTLRIIYLLSGPFSPERISWSVTSPR